MSMRTQNKYKQMQAVENKPKRRSALLTETEKRRLTKYMDTFATIVESAEAIGIHRNVLDRVILTGSGSPETVEKIRKAVN